MLDDFDAGPKGHECTTILEDAIGSCVVRTKVYDVDREPHYSITAIYPDGKKCNEGPRNWQHFYIAHEWSRGTATEAIKAHGQVCEVIRDAQEQARKARESADAFLKKLADMFAPTGVKPDAEKLN